MPEHCYQKHPEVRKEVYLIWVFLLLFIPSVIGIYFFIQPKIERTYLVEIYDDFQIDVFPITYFNYTTNTTESLELSLDDIDQSFHFTAIRLGFNKFTNNYADSEYLNAYLYRNSSFYSLNYQITNGQYLVRSFDISNLTLTEFMAYSIKFKIPQVYRLFFIEIECELINQVITIPFSFYQFFADELSTGTECQIEFQGIHYIEPNIYSILSNVQFYANTIYLFDFTFR